MSKKDYEMIAASLRRTRSLVPSIDGQIAVDRVIVEMCNDLERDYKGAYAFKRDTFLKAAGFGE